MGAAPKSAPDSTAAYFWLSPGGAAEAVSADGFWNDFAAIGRKAETSAFLVTAFDLDADFPHWEMHPEGDELLIAQSGAYRAILEQDGARSEHGLAAGQTLLIPRGAWHFLKTLEPGRIVFVTAGKGTQHRSLDDAPL